MSQLAPPQILGESTDSVASSSATHNTFLPTVAGAGGVKQFTSSAQYIDKDLPLPPVAEQAEYVAGHVRGGSNPITADELELKLASVPTPPPLSVPQIPLPSAPSKSGMRTQTHSRSVSLPVRFAENHDIIESIPHLSSDSTDSEGTGTTSALPGRDPKQQPPQQQKQKLQEQQLEKPSPQAAISAHAGFNFPLRGSGPSTSAAPVTGETKKSVPSPPFGLPSLSTQASLGEVIALAGDPLTGLEDFPAPPFLIKQAGSSSEGSNLDSSNESYETAHSHDSSGDEPERTDPAAAVGALPTERRFPSFAQRSSPQSPQTRSFVSKTKPFVFGTEAPGVQNHHLSMASSDFSDYAPPSRYQDTTAPTHTVPSTLSPAAVIATRESKATTLPLPRQGHQRTISSPLLSRMPPPPPSISGSSLRDSIISLGHSKQRSFDSTASEASKFEDRGDLTGANSPQGQTLSEITEKQEASPPKSDVTSGTGTITTGAAVVPVALSVARGSKMRDESEYIPPKPASSSVLRHASGSSARSKRRHASETNGRHSSTRRHRESREDRRVSSSRSMPQVSIDSVGSTTREMDTYLNQESPAASAEDSLLPAAGTSFHFSKRSPNSRPFSTATIQKLMDLSDSTFRLEEIDMPPTERQLIEKFVNALAKLSADINDDKNKRPEGIRRLHNALRAIEGWI